MEGRKKKLSESNSAGLSKKLKAKETNIIQPQMDPPLLDAVLFTKIEDPDDPGFVGFDPNCLAICFCTEDSNSISIPRIYFIPKRVVIPDCIKGLDRFYRAEYEPENPDTKQPSAGFIGSWLAENAEATIDCSKFVCATSFGVAPSHGRMIPKFSSDALDGC